MKKIVLVSILFAVSLLAYSQEIQGLWETRFQIVDDPLNGIFSASLAKSPGDGIMRIKFEEELGTIIFFTGKEQYFAWTKYVDFISISYLIKKQNIFVAEAKPSLIAHAFTDEGMLVLRWERGRSFDDLSDFYLIMEHIAQTGDPPDPQP